ncbi:MAG TPA: asparagine synthase-related protein, partial [Anaerohalosphaeraceae bacterium]|nr:asparagine synthase-related protein [Anaerohalosphaeraceae bacterium]
MKHFSPDLLKLDYDRTVQTIVGAIRKALRDDLKRKGLVVAVSGGIDSSTVAALCVEAVGKERVFNLLLPEQDSSPETYRLSRMIPQHLGTEYIEENITPILEAFGCYRRRDEAIRQVVPQ